MIEIKLSPRGRERLINRKLGKRGYSAKTIHTGKEYIVFANEVGKVFVNNDTQTAAASAPAEHQICTFNETDNVYIIMNSKKLRDSIAQLELMKSPIEAMRIAKEFEENSQRAELREKARWLMERFAGIVKQIGYGDTGD